MNTIRTQVSKIAHAKIIYGIYHKTGNLLYLNIQWQTELKRDLDSFSSGWRHKGVPCVC